MSGECGYCKRVIRQTLTVRVWWEGMHLLFPRKVLRPIGKLDGTYDSCGARLPSFMSSLHRHCAAAFLRHYRIKSRDVLYVLDPADVTEGNLRCAWCNSTMLQGSPPVFYSGLVQVHVTTAAFDTAFIFCHPQCAIAALRAAGGLELLLLGGRGIRKGA
mgnify:CR=1 FL=1